MIAGKDKLCAYFDELLEKHGDHYLALDWKSQESQNVRFAVLLDIISFCDKTKTMSMLDVGSGLGHLYGFMEEVGFLKSYKVDYHGIDISKKMIDRSKNKFPGIDFNVVDLINDKYEKKYDYVVSSGAFNLKMADLETHKVTIRRMLSRMYNLCNKGVAVNFLSNPDVYVATESQSPEDSRYVYFTEEEVIAWVRAIAPRYTLRKDYHPGDFTVYMLK
jgi:SAM-dependent methyltransferase